MSTRVAERLLLLPSDLQRFHRERITLYRVWNLSLDLFYCIRFA